VRVFDERKRRPIFFSDDSNWEAELGPHRARFTPLIFSLPTAAAT
jgi:hypothetical protein